MSDATTLPLLLSVLQCHVCHDSQWQTVPLSSSAALVTCAGCGQRHRFEGGILKIGNADEHVDVTNEKAAVLLTELSPELGGWKEVVSSASTIDPALRAAYLSLPYGDGSFRFDEPGYFANVSRFAPEFDFILRHLPATGGRLLDLGADGTWSTARLASRGFECVALDITDHLTLGDVFQSVYPAYARIIVDMHAPVFGDARFDVITAFNAMHHSRRLPLLAERIGAMLKPGGVLAFVEPYVQNEEQALAFGGPQLDVGINETVRTVVEWDQAFRDAGLSIVRCALSDSFNAIYRKPLGGESPRALHIGADGLIDGYYAAQLTGVVVTPSVAANTEAEFRITVSNSGPAAWASRGPHPTRLSYHVSRVEDEGAVRLLAFENPRVELPRFIDAGEKQELAVRALFREPGLYELEFDLVHEMRRWFSEHGGKTCRLRCEVV